ncbi:MAG: hypothetical protein HC916_00525 [Coleofasciculaceae cyanobacterium SM2_1_6]|nr:hypothetical protein [Coleofasciculaceae cyanobacterium SM2_1_6]
MVRQLKSLRLHQADLQQCFAILSHFQNFQELQNTQGLLELNKALGFTSLSLYFKIFTPSKARIMLDKTKVFRDQPEFNSSFNHFQNIRNKYLLNDENTQTKSLVGLLLDQESQPVAVISSAEVGIILDDREIQRLRELVEFTLGYLSQKSADIESQLLAIYQTWSIPELINIPDISN